MSNIYIQEPPTSGKVLLKTTVGDIDLELWSKEAPKACKNFVQLCLEGYYNQTMFHRVVKNFIVQGGDPTGSGTGGESVYGEPFKDEFHSRLRFNRRGLVAIANAGPDDNASQFFFTLAATPELQNKHTIFAKVTRETIFNVLKLQETLVDKDERPVYPQKILKTEVLHNPFPDIIPRVSPKEEEKKDDKKKKDKRSGVKNFKLLSFGEEAEEDEEQSSEANKKYSGKSKSTHDLLNDPKLSAKPAVSLEEKVQESEEIEIASEGIENRNPDPSPKEGVEEESNEREVENNSLKESEEKMKDPSEADKDVDRRSESNSRRRSDDKKLEISVDERDKRRVSTDSKSRKRSASSNSEQNDEHLSGDETVPVSQASMETLRKKLKGDKSTVKLKEPVKSSRKEEHNQEGEGDSEKINIQKEIRALKRELHATKKSKQVKENEEKEKKERIDPGPLSEYLQSHQKYKALKTQLPKKGSEREAFTMALLSKFQMKLAYAKDKAMERAESEEQPNEMDSISEENSDDWLTHKLQFESHDTNPAKDANTKTDDWFEIYDPRNPINKRRREASKETMRQKERH